MAFSDGGWTDAGILSVLGVNSLIALVLLGVFCLLRANPKLKDVYAPRTDTTLYQAAIPDLTKPLEYESSYFGWVLFIHGI